MLSIGWLQSVIKTERWSYLHRLTVVAFQLLTFILCIAVAFLLRFEFVIPQTYNHYLLYSLLTWIPIKLIVFILFGLDRGWWRFVSIYDIMELVYANVLGSIFCAIVTIAAGPPAFPRSLYILDLLACFVSTSGQRVFIRILSDLLVATKSDLDLRVRIFIYGAGSAGVILLREIRSNPKLHYVICGFIDDNPRKRGLVIQGVRVLGAAEDLAKLVPRYRVAEILIALPSATGSDMSKILDHCHISGVQCRTIPALGEIIARSSISLQLRDVAVEDLLGRRPIRLEEDEIRSSIQGKVILVTGAAGSIGSELCRQIARFKPSAIVGLEIAESPLFEIDREMRQIFPYIPFYPEIGSIQNRSRIREILRQYAPSTLYHAAAYKHVPMMETHIFEAVENNVFGTYNIATEAANHGVEDFVMISSDKAVRPTNIMGATKRVSELLLLTLRDGGTKYVSVRFGNVLGSSGSVIPIFKKQIAAGGPVTVTHPEMQRFFMTIPEACQLVLQAAVIGKNGQICVLDMGKPVKIVDLAKKLILLSGLKVDEDIKIRFTGVRPGEKLYEELNTVFEDTVPTNHEKIRIFVGNGILECEMDSWLSHLRKACETRDTGALVVALKGLLLDYNPSVYLLERLMGEHKGDTISLSA